MSNKRKWGVYVTIYLGEVEAEDYDDSLESADQARRFADGAGDAWEYANRQHGCEQETDQCDC